MEVALTGNAALASEVERDDVGA